MINHTLLKQIRTESGLTQVEFAEELGISQAYMSILEAGYRDINFELAYKLQRLASRYGIDAPLEEIRPDIWKNNRVDKG